MAEERKTLEQRAQMTDIERLRHSAAHVLATAILRIWPEAQFAAGPPVEQGFYYDVELPHRITPEDFEKIEAEMKKETKANNVFEKVVVSREEALAMAQRGELAALAPRGEASKFKLDIIQNIPRAKRSRSTAMGSSPTSAPARTSCARGISAPSSSRTSPAPTTKATRKTRSCSASTAPPSRTRRRWRPTSRCWRRRRKRDHRKLGKELELFCFDDDVGPGLPMWLPRGTVLLEELEKLRRRRSLRPVISESARRTWLGRTCI
jgi:threonyl-tRNA synthetase